MDSGRHRILITHPGRQHSHQASIALASQNMLAGYWSGVPILKRHGSLIPGKLWDRYVRYAPLNISEDLCKWMPAAVILRNVSRRILPASSARTLDFLACRLFDRQGAAAMKCVTAQAVSACEISALHIFEQAKKQGWITILDAPSVHHTLQDRSRRYPESAELHQRIIELKDKEIELSDHIVTVSEFARNSYIDAGVPADKVHSVPLGVDTELFRPLSTSLELEDIPFTFLFAGTRTFHKGIDLLIAAFRKVRSEYHDVVLKMVGPKADDSEQDSLSSDEGIIIYPTKKQQELARDLAGAHCFVFPSRLDSYGMVVAEALACGTPVIVTESVGAKMLVAEGINGWVIPDNSVRVLAERMAWCAEHRRELHKMRIAARESVKDATWKTYATAYVDLMRSIMKKAI